jgi:hypothetical protein
MPQTTGSFPPAYSNLVTQARTAKKTKANPFPMAAAIKKMAKTAPALPPLRKKRPAPTPAQDKAIFAKTKGRGR